VELNPGQDPPRLASHIVLLYLSFLVCISAQEHPYNLLTRYSTLAQFFNASLHTQPSSLLPNPHCMGTSVLLRYCASLIEKCLFKSCIITLGLSSLQNYTTRLIMFSNKNVASSAIQSTRMASDFLLIQFLHTILKHLVVRSAWYRLLRFTSHPAE